MTTTASSTETASAERAAIASHGGAAIAEPESTPGAAAQPSRPPSPTLVALNDRLKAALPNGPVSTTKQYGMGAYQSDRVLDAYEAALAPPLEILLKTFGLIYTKRTAGQADSIAYVYERTRILGVDVCTAYTIVEHPLRVAVKANEYTGPIDHPTLPGPLGDLKPEISKTTVPCNAKGMIPVVAGSMTSPAPRHPELASPSPSP